MHTPDGEYAGTVVNMLFDPAGAPVIVGAAVRPPNALVVVGRPETYIPLSGLKFQKGHVFLLVDKLPKAKASAASLGYDPAFTVIWSHMPLVGPSGREVGTIADFEFDPDTGAVSRLVADSGAVAHAAYGRLDVPLDAIGTYDNGAVSISMEAVDLEATGGIAKGAASAVAGAVVTAQVAGEVVGDAVLKASGAAGRAVRVVKDSGVAKKAAKSVGSTWRDTVQAFRDGMKDD